MTAIKAGDYFLERDRAQVKRRYAEAETVFKTLPFLVRLTIGLFPLENGIVDFGAWDPETNPDRVGTPRVLPLYLFKCGRGHISRGYKNGYPENERLACHCGATRRTNSGFFLQHAESIYGRAYLWWQLRKLKSKL